MAEHKRYTETTGAIDIEVSKTTLGDKLAEVRVHLSAAATQDDLTITLDSAAGPEFDVNFLTQDMTGVQDLVYIPDRPIFLVGDDDKVIIAWDNTDDETYGVEVITEK